MKRKSGLWLPVALAAALYVVVATVTFALRHPWMTDTERTIYFPRALVFGSVDYSEARPR